MIRTNLVRLRAEPAPMRMEVVPTDPAGQATPLPERPFFATWSLSPDWRERLLGPDPNKKPS